MRVLIVEDEKVAARGLERMLREILGTRLSTLKILGGFTAAEYYLLDNPIDLLLLDLNLNGEDGFDLLKTATAGSFQTIVVSGNTDRAVEAYDYGVLDFVPKPVNQERLTRALERMESAGEKSGNFARYLSVRKDETVELIALEKVSYFQGHDNYVIIQLKDGTQEKHRKTLESLEKILPPQFRRIHRSYLANIGEIARLHAHGGGKYEAELKSGELLPVSRARFKDLKESV